MTLAGLVAALVLGALVAGPAPASRGRAALEAGTVTEATWNAWYRNPAPYADLPRVLRLADLVRLQEITTRRNRTALEAALTERPEIRAYFPRATGLVIAWDRTVFTPTGRPGRILVRPRAHGLPARWTIWQPLRHRATGTVVLVVNVHAIAGGCGTGPLRQRASMMHWQTLRGITAAAGYARVLLGGDFNCRLSSRRWWAPARTLTGYRFDRWPGIDHLATRGPGIRTVARWQGARYHSDHAVQLRRITFPAS